MKVLVNLVRMISRVDEHNRPHVRSARAIRFENEIKNTKITRRARDGENNRSYIRAVVAQIYQESSFRGVAEFFRHISQDGWWHSSGGNQERNRERHKRPKPS